MRRVRLTAAIRRNQLAVRRRATLLVTLWLQIPGEGTGAEPARSTGRAVTRTGVTATRTGRHWSQVLVRRYWNW
jgi:hypothetical protein